MKVRHFASKSFEGVTYKQVDLDRLDIINKSVAVKNVLYNSDGAIKTLFEVYKDGSSFETDDFKQELIDLAEHIFSESNPLTRQLDFNSAEYYSWCTALVYLTDCFPCQFYNNIKLFNQYGSVTVAEVLDGFNAIWNKANSVRSDYNSLDNIVSKEDYFLDGYNSCVETFSSPMYNLYTRAELVSPITRFELAYITVICWNKFREAFGNPFGVDFRLGYTFDWLFPNEILQNYNDGMSYQLSKVSNDDKNDTISLNIKDYISDRSVSEYKEDLTNGTAAFPLPVLMSLVELGELNLFYFDKFSLLPLQGLSRGEFSYFLVQLAKVFSNK